MDLTWPKVKIKSVVVTWSDFPNTSATSNIVTFTVCHMSHFISEKNLPSLNYCQQQSENKLLLGNVGHFIKRKRHVPLCDYS
jgi:hypothetical protein